MVVNQITPFWILIIILRGQNLCGVVHNTTFFPLPQKQFQSTGKWLASKAVRETETWPGLRQRTSGDNLKGHYRAMGKQTTEVWSQTTYIVVAPQNAIHFCFGGKFKSVKKFELWNWLFHPIFYLLHRKNTYYDGGISIILLRTALYDV